MKERRDRFELISVIYAIRKLYHKTQS